MYFQIDTKKANIANLEATVDDLKKRSANQLDEINRLEDQLRNLNIEQTSMQSKIDTLSINVSAADNVCGSVCQSIFIFHDKVHFKKGI